MKKIILNKQPIINKIKINYKNLNNYIPNDNNLYIEINDLINLNDLVVLKLKSKLNYNSKLSIYINEFKLKNSDKLYNSEWYTYNFIDPNIYGQPKIIHIFPALNIDKIEISFMNRNEKNLNFNSLVKKVKKQINTNIIPKRNINIAIISSEFTFNNFNLECNCTYIPNNITFINDLDIDKFDLFICESTFRGIDGTWINEISKYDNVNYGQNLFILVNKFHEKNKECIFYNKEDPLEFDIFFNASKIFDTVITTDNNSVQKYANKKVLCYPFIINPVLHNPLGKSSSKLIAYPGSYYRYLADRSYLMDINLKKISNLYPIDIYDRFFLNNKLLTQSNSKNNNYMFPECFNKFIYPSINSIDVCNQVYKKYKFVLNFNTITNSETMCSRRAIELAGCGTNIISDKSTALVKLFKNNIIFFDNINSLDSYDNINLNLYYKTHLNLTFENLLTKLNNKFINKSNNIMLIVSKNIKCSNEYFNYLIIDIDTYLKNQSKFIYYHKFFILDETSYFDIKYFRKFILPINYCNNNIYITTNKLDYFQTTSEQYINNIYLENCNNTDNNNIYINDNMPEYYKDVCYLNDIHIETIKSIDSQLDNINIFFSITKEDMYFDNIINSLLKLKRIYSINLYIFNNFISLKNDIENYFINVNDINIFIYHSTYNFNSFGNIIMIKNVINLIKTDKIIIMNDIIDSNIDLSRNYDLIGINYDFTNKIYNFDNLIICNKSIFENENIYYLNKKYSKYSELWILFNCIINNKTICKELELINRQLDDLELEFMNFIIREIDFDVFNL
jgi:hypothetical protein